MGLNGKTRVLDLEAQSVVLVSFEISRSEANRALPWPRGVVLIPKDAKSRSEAQLLKIDEEGMDYGDGSRYIALMRLSLPPGKYTLERVWGELKRFPFQGIWNVPLLMTYDVPPKSVVYAGRISAHMRPRTDQEFRAGALIPLIDQAALGISGGTFDVSVADHAAVDLERFREAFPALKDVAIGTALLPAFDREPFDREFKGTPSRPNTSPEPSSKRLDLEPVAQN